MDLPVMRNCTLAVIPAEHLGTPGTLSAVRDRGGAEVGRFAWCCAKPMIG